MGLQACAVFQSSDVCKDAWSRLSHFQNVEMTADKICKKHNIEKKDRRFAMRQATQIRHCLLQAREYFNAAKGVSLATKPVLLYYSAMSLALCEVLYKSDGESRLERLRENHNCHGLQLALATDIPVSMPLSQLGAAIGAKPQMANGGQRGTFEVWHRTSAEPPLVGWLERRFPLTQTTQKSFAVLMGGDASRPDPLPRSGISLMECLQRLPRMYATLESYGIDLELVRASCSAQVTDDSTAVVMPGFLDIIVHPSTSSAFERFGEQVRFNLSAMPQIDVTELPSNSARIVFRTSEHGGFFALPWSITADTSMTWFSTRRESLNEFGLYYVALHMLGNVARYYPDKWLAHIESHTPLAVVAEALLDLAVERLPLLLLSELREQYLVVER